MKPELYPYTLKNDKYVIFSCGRLVYYKGFSVLIDSAKYLPGNCIIRIAGEGKLYTKLNKQIVKNGLSEKVFLLGRITNEQMEEELQNCFLFCLSSIQRSEMYAVVQIDAFCHGKPVISTKIPRSGVPEINKDGSTGYTVDINDPKIIADKVSLLLQDNELYKTFCNNALNYGKDLTDCNIVDKYIQVFKDIINTNSG